MNKFKKFLAPISFVGLLGVVFGFLWILSHWNQPKNQGTAITQNEILKGFEFESIDGQSFWLDNISEDVVIVHFWASWCGPCVKEIPELVRLASELKSVKILAISGDENIRDIEKFLQLYPSLKNDNTKIILDRQHHWMSRFGVTGVPESFVLDRNHKLIRHFVGPANWADSSIRTWLTNLNSQTP